MAEDLRYLGRTCRRCDCPLLENEWEHCGGKNPEGINCSAAVARESLAAMGGVRTWKDLHPDEQARI